MRTRERGFSLLGTIFAAGIILLLLTAVADLAVRLSQTTRVTKDRLIATFLAREGIELVRAIRDTNWISAGRCPLGQIWQACSLPWRGPGPLTTDAKSLCNGTSRVDAANLVASGLVPDTVGSDSTALFFKSGQYVHDSTGTPTPFKRWVRLANADANPTDNCGKSSVYLPLFRDDFKRSDNSNPGPNWSENNGDFSISTERLVAQSGTVNNIASLSSVPQAPNVSVEARYNISSGSAGLLARYSGGITNGDVSTAYLGEVTPTGAGIFVYRDGVRTSLEVKPGSFSTGLLRFEVADSTLRLYQDNALIVGPVNDPTPLGSGLVGVRMSGPSGQWYDDVRVTVPPPPEAHRPAPLNVTSVVQWVDNGVTRTVQFVEQLYPWIHTR